MAMLLNYKKATYEAKIKELEGYRSQLESHLGNLERLSGNVSTFWEHDGAKEMSQLLSVSARQVRHVLDRLTEIKNAYEANQSQIDGQSKLLDDAREKALHDIESLGI